MKNISELQQELRNIRKDLAKIDEHLSEIDTELTSIKNAGQSDTNATQIDYETIGLLSRHLSFGTHPLHRLDDYACQIYLEILLSLVQTDRDSDDTVNRLIFVQWLLSQTKLEQSLEELCKDSMKINTQTFAEVVKVIPEVYKKHLLMDALLTANIGGQATTDVLHYVVDLCSILCVDNEQLRIFSITAKSILQQDIGKMEKDDFVQVLNKLENYRHYLKCDIVEQALVPLRTIAVQVPYSDAPYGLTWDVKHHKPVQEGDVLATYRERSPNGLLFYSTMRTLTAPCAGTLFCFNINDVNYGVIAHENDKLNNIRAWVLKKPASK